MTTPWYHAHSHVNSLNGLGACYAAKNERHRTPIKGWEMLMNGQILVTAGGLRSAL
jgi:hypothetical protein